MGTPFAFAIGVLMILVWAVSGSYFRYSETWQLVINTGTTIVTFLMVFIIQNTQNRDSRAIHLKLDELLRTVAAARKAVIDLEDKPEEKLQELKKEFETLSESEEPLDQTPQG
jgi:low affinity Fe/Cu permease